MIVIEQRQRLRLNEKQVRIAMFSFASTFDLPEAKLEVREEVSRETLFARQCELIERSFPKSNTFSTDKRHKRRAFEC